MISSEFRHCVRCDKLRMRMLPEDKKVSYNNVQSVLMQITSVTDRRTDTHKE